jgi:hypothetical protein
MVTVMDIIAIAIVIVMVAKDALPKKAVYAIHSLLLIGFGLFPLILYFNLLTFDIFSYGIAKYVALFVVIVAGQELFKTGLKEDNKVLQIVSLVLGVAIIVITALPQLTELGAISFTMPAYTPIIDFAFYLACGILLLIGLTKITD